MFFINLAIEFAGGPHNMLQAPTSRKSLYNKQLENCSRFMIEVLPTAFQTETLTLTLIDL